jgi:hypothetical protein
MTKAEFLAQQIPGAVPADFGSMSGEEIEVLIRAVRRNVLVRRHRNAWTFTPPNWAVPMIMATTAGLHLVRAADLR